MQVAERTRIERERGGKFYDEGSTVFLIVGCFVLFLLLLLGCGIGRLKYAIRSKKGSSS
jgi:hypothetical protein